MMSNTHHGFFTFLGAPNSARLARPLPTALQNAPRRTRKRLSLPLVNQLSIVRQLLPASIQLRGFSPAPDACLAQSSMRCYLGMELA